MRSILASILLALAVVGSGPSFAEQRTDCPYGRTFAGSCVDGARAERLRTQANLMVQRRISSVYQMTLPRQDRAFLSAGSRSYIR